MLQVSKLGATVLGKGTRSQSALSRTMSFPFGSFEVPTGMVRLLLVNTTHRPVSLLEYPCARITVKLISSMLTEWRYMTSELTFVFVTKIRRGTGSLHVRIGGLGSLA